MPIRSTILIIAISFLWAGTENSHAQDAVDKQLQRLLKQYPKADTNGDGSLTISEAQAFRDKNRARSKPQAKAIAPPPTHENVKYGTFDRNVFDIWCPESKTPTPLIVYIHGGGFVGGNKEQIRRSKNVARALELGVAFASIQYRYRYPDDGDMSDPQRTSIQNILRDSARAIQYMRLHAKKYNLAPTKIACFGGSAGAGTSIWLAFHDDLADPDNPDPVLRQSSRISAAGMLAGQFTYDLRQWDREFSDLGGELAKTHGRNGILQTHRFYGLTKSDYEGPTGEAICADVDMRGLISADDPPVFVQTDNPDRPPVTRGIYNHHPRHAQLIEKRCKECGVEVLCLVPKVEQADADALKQNPDLMMDFFFKCLGVQESDEGEGKTPVGTKAAPAPLPIAKPESVGVDSDKLAKIKPTLQKFVDDRRIGGAVVGVVRRGKLIALEAVGMQDIASSMPMSTDTIFRIYSMTKPIATVAALILADEGRLKLDDPVSKYLPEFSDANVFVSKSGDKILTEPLTRAVTIRDLMRHTSGLTYGFFGNSPVDGMYRNAGVLSDADDAADLCRKAAGIPLICQPGTKFNYSVSVDVLGRVIEVASGKPLDVFMQHRIFDPLGMVDTGFYVRPESRSRFATSYSPKIGGGLTVKDDPATSRFIKKPKMLSGGGGLVSTAGDYLRFAQMLLGGGQLGDVRILKQATVAEMTSNQLPGKAYPIRMFGLRIPGVGFGLGVSVVVEAKLPGQLVGEYGWDGIASTHYWASEKEELAVVVLTQHSPFTTELKFAVKPHVDEAIAK